MKVLQYGFFGEDRGQREFLAAYLLHFKAEATRVIFEPVAYFGKKFGPMNNKVVDRRCADACREAFVLGHPRLDWLFVGRDVDSFDPARHEYLTNELLAKIPEQWHGRTLLLLPVQCIEHWLLYLARHPDREPLERKPNDRAKEMVYNDHTKSRGDTRLALVRSLTPERVAWLAEVSASFLAFHKQVEAHLKTLASA